jgi:predicted dienelactone hydrolase
MLHRTDHTDGYFSLNGAMTMTRLSFILTALLCLATSLAHAAGFQFIEVPGSGALQPLKGAVWYPCAQPANEVKLGPFIMSVAKDCPIAGKKLPLVVISHGRGGTFLDHRDTAEILADAGFIVVAINHPGDNAMDKSRTGEFGLHGAPGRYQAGDRLRARLMA